MVCATSKASDQPEHHLEFLRLKQGRRNRGGTGGGRASNNLHKYAVLLITKVCHFKKNYVCPPPHPNLLKNLCVPPPPPPPQSVIASYGPAKGGCTGSGESTLVKMPHCWKSHVTAHLSRDHETHSLFIQYITISSCFLHKSCQSSRWV